MNDMDTKDFLPVHLILGVCDYTESDRGVIFGVFFREVLVKHKGRFAC